MVGGSGGAHITVQGNSFDPFPGNTEVTVGSAPCPLVSVTDTELVCAAPAQEEMAGTELGTRGLLHELWNNTEIEVKYLKLFKTFSNQIQVTDTSSLNVSAPDYFSMTHDGGAVLGPVQNETSGYTQRLSGYIVAPYTGQVSFFLQARKRFSNFLNIP